MPCSWEGNRRSGVALALRQTLVVLHLEAQGLEEGDEHLPTLSYGELCHFYPESARFPLVIILQPFDTNISLVCSGSLRLKTYMYLLSICLKKFSVNYLTVIGKISTGEK